MTDNAPGPRSLSDDDLSQLLGAHQFGTLATNKRSGHPHLTNMVYAWDPAERVVRMSTTTDRIKVRQLRSDSRAALLVSTADHWSFAVAEGEAVVSEPTSTPGDPVGRELLAMLPPAVRPEDPVGFLAQQVAERRVVIRLKVNRLYGTALDMKASS